MLFSFTCVGTKHSKNATASTINFIGGDAWYVTVKNDTHYFSDIDYGSRVLSGVDFRAKNFDAIDNLEQNSLDFYASVKFILTR